jgi:nucleoside-diphosphate-sugar epimerase
MKIIITGAAGLLGLHLLPHFKESKHEILAIDKNKHNLNLVPQLLPQAKVYEADLSANPSTWKSLFDNADCVIQLHAQITSPYQEKHHRNNVFAIQNILKVCEEQSIKHLVHMSSSVVLTHATDHYTTTKRRGEAFVSTSTVPHTILRPPLMYGIFERKHLGKIMDLMARFPLIPFPGSGNYLRQPLYVEDLCAVILQCINIAPSQRSYNIIGHENIKFIDLIKQMAKQQNIDSKLLKIPLPIFQALLKISSFLPNSPPFIPEQLTALTAGDHFNVDPWTKTFQVAYTPFAKALKEMDTSPLKQLRSSFQDNQ